MPDQNQSARRELGPLVATYGASRSFLAVGRLLALLFAGVGAFVLWLASRIGSGGLQFSGDPRLLQSAGFGLIAFGVAAEVLIRVLLARQVTVHVHENAMRAIGRGRDQVDFFADIEDVYLVSTGLFGWRSTPRTPWVIVDNRVTRMAELREQLVRRQLAQRGERLWQRLQAGAAITFHLVPHDAARRQIWVDARNVDHPVTPITLTARELTIASRTVPVARLRKMDRSIWHEHVKFVDVDGQVIHATASNAILSLDLLLALIEELQRPPARWVTVGRRAMRNASCRPA